MDDLVSPVREATIYHGTPMTPRAALKDVCAGRAMCVSFFRPDDVEVVEAISPDIMFRQRGFFVLAGGHQARRGLGRDRGLATVLRLAGATAFHAGPLGDRAGHSGGAVPAQRHAAADLAVWTEGRASLAHGRTDRAAASPVRALGQGMLGLDRSEGRRARLSRTHGGSQRGARQQMAGPAHAPRHSCGFRLPVRVGGQHLTRAERVAV